MGLFVSINKSVELTKGEEKVLEALKLCKEYKDKNGNVIMNFSLAGDRLQSIYNKNEISWISIGIDMRARSKL